jgi:hypothetical protein
MCVKGLVDDGNKPWWGKDVRQIADEMIASVRNLVREKLAWKEAKI